MTDNYDTLSNLNQIVQCNQKALKKLSTHMDYVGMHYFGGKLINNNAISVL